MWILTDAPLNGLAYGRAAAILLVRSGAKVLVADREQKLAERTVDMIGRKAAANVIHRVLGGPAAQMSVGQPWSASLVSTSSE
jgi:NAD(P)-dependent dehydrogenase (short-subunit alcohol dehydrogenase family)